MLDRMEGPSRTSRLKLEDLENFHYLYERPAAGSQENREPFPPEPETRRYLENLIARAWGNP